MRKSRFFIPLILVLGLFSCKEKKPKTDPPMQTITCPGLDSLFQTMELTEKQLTNGQASWEVVRGNLDILYLDLKNNLADEKGGDCFFLSNYYEHEEDRFYFIELLTETIIRENLEEGILYLVKFRGLFIMDKEITEFISEDLAHVAYHNPTVYLSYLQHHAEQEEMLLNSTRWVTTDKETLIQSFDTLDGSENIVQFLRDRI